MHSFFTDVYKLVIDTILPIRCTVCRKEHTEAVCNDCIQHMELVIHQRCVVCGKSSPFGLTHVLCKTTQTPDRTLCLLQYKSPGCAESIITGKYKFIPSVFTVYGKLLAQHFETELQILNKDQVIITSLPLHPRRKRWRGYNQSEILAKTYAEYLGLHYEDTLVRVRSTKTQKDLNKDKRIENVQNSFALSPVAALKEKIILLIDDVTTTGSTLQEAAKILKQNGALSVWCIALAQD